MNAGLNYKEEYLWVECWMRRADTESFRRRKEQAKPLILELIGEHSFLALKSVQISLERRNYWHTVTWNAIQDLRREGLIRTAKYPPRGAFPTWVYRSDLRINDIRETIDNELKPIYNDFIRRSSNMGLYCETIIEKALTDTGFITLSKRANTRYFRGRIYPRRKDLDIIAYKEGVFYGIEVKNNLAYPNWNIDIIQKKQVADYHGIQFVLFSRTLGPYGYDLFQCGGLHLEFDYIFWSPNFSSLAERIEESLYFPIICADKPTEELISKTKELQNLHDRHFYGIGRI